MVHNEIFGVTLLVDALLGWAVHKPIMGSLREYYGSDANRYRHEFMHGDNR